jgi:hypothetical protein
MNLSKRDRTALAILGGALCVFLLVQYVVLPATNAPASAAVSMSADQLRQRVVRLRQIAASLPVREALLKQTDADLADRERGSGWYSRRSAVRSAPDRAENRQVERNRRP